MTISARRRVFLRIRNDNEHSLRVSPTTSSVFRVGAETPGMSTNLWCTFGFLWISYQTRGRWDKSVNVEVGDISSRSLGSSRPCQFHSFCQARLSAPLEIRMLQRYHENLHYQIQWSSLLTFTFCTYNVLQSSIYYIKLKRITCASFFHDN